MDSNLNKLVEIWRSNQSPGSDLKKNSCSLKLEFEELNLTVYGEVDWDTNNQWYFLNIKQIYDSLNQKWIRINDKNLSFPSVIEHLAILHKLQTDYGLDFFEFSTEPSNVVYLK